MSHIGLHCKLGNHYGFCLSASTVSSWVKESLLSDHTYWSTYTYKNVGVEYWIHNISVICRQEGIRIYPAAFLSLHDVHVRGGWAGLGHGIQGAGEERGLRIWNMTVWVCFALGIVTLKHTHFSLHYKIAFLEKGLDLDSKKGGWILAPRKGLDPGSKKGVGSWLQERGLVLDSI